jgi:Secretion system C-terminal sorting domain/PKD domain/WD40-like Beta Propeller Repeat
MKPLILILPIFLLSIFGKTFAQNTDSDYLGLTKPGEIPEIFAPDFVSTNYAEFAGTFSPDFTEYYFTRRGSFAGGIAQIMVTKKTGDNWSDPEVAEFSSNNYEFEPFITPDGKKLYYGSRRSPDGSSPAGTMHQWYLQKINSQWSDPILLGTPFFETMVMYPTVANNRTIYFTDIDGIYFSKLVNNMYQTPVKLGDEINYLPRSAHSYIAPDESYLIYDGQPRGEGKTDIYISYKKDDGTWTKSKSLGKKVNSGESQAIASVSPDGECLFFTRNEDIYWMDANIIHDLKNIPAFTISQNTGNAPFTVQISTDLSTIPEDIVSFAWDFNNDGEVESNDQNPEYTFLNPGMYSIKLKVFTENDSSSRVFENIIEVFSSTTGYEIINESQKKKQNELFQNYPNPFTKNTTISYTLVKEENTEFTVYNSLGIAIYNVINGMQKPGNYSFTYDASGFDTGVYFYQLKTNNICYTKNMLIQN